MSASLVGSEMCIRDSLRRWPSSAHCCAHRVPVPTPRRAQASGRNAERGPRLAVFWDGKPAPEKVMAENGYDFGIAPKDIVAKRGK
eukprot:2619647-Alexandrium_andersonii.AAC.1